MAQTADLRLLRLQLYENPAICKQIISYALHKLRIIQARFRSSIIFSTMGRKMISIAKPIMPPGMTMEL